MKNQFELVRLIWATLLFAPLCGCIFPSAFDQELGEATDVSVEDDADADAVGADATTDTSGGCPQCVPGQSCCLVAGVPACVNPSSDPAHCGSCDTVCGSGICLNGECLTLCDPGQVICQDPMTNLETCVDPTTVENCGGCGVACAPSEACVDGLCECQPAPGSEPRPCTTGESCCPGAGCQSLLTSESHCGACNNACGFGESCNDGVCECGGATACQAGESCCNGSCCAAGMLCCGDACVAADDPMCVCGMQSSCSVGQTCCGSECSSLDDETHCGACSNNCEVAEVCSSGMCECATGFGDCSAAPGCETAVSTDNNHCGTCGVVCPQDTTCIDGVCDCGGGGACVGGSCCDGACVDTLSSLLHCGGCNMACPASTMGQDVFVCASGSCSLSCEEGFEDCNGDPNDGCEAPCTAGCNPSTLDCFVQFDIAIGDNDLDTHKGVMEDFGTENSALTANYDNGSRGAGHEVDTEDYIWLRFPLSMIPPTATITEVRLEMYTGNVLDADGATSAELVVAVGLDTVPATTWSETDANHATYNGTDGWSGGADGGLADTGLVVDSVFLPNSSENLWLTWNFTPAAIASEVAPRVAAGDPLELFVHRPTTGSDRVLGMSEKAEGTRPRLVVTYFD